MANALELRKQIKKKKPHFIRQDSHKRVKVGTGWRKPKGIHSKLRQRWGRRKMVEPGYGSPKEAKFLHSSGMKVVRVENISQVAGIDKKTTAVEVSGKLGLKKKIALLTELSEKGITVINVKDPKKFIEDSRARIAENKKTKEERVKEKESKKKTEKKEEKESIEDKLSDEEKKKLEKQEIDRLLTKKF